MGDSNKAPRHLRAATRRWWESVNAEYELGDHHKRLLTAAAESWDEAEQAGAAVRKGGMIFSDRFGQPRERPEVAIARQARTTFARLLRELNLDIQPPGEVRLPRGGRY